MRLQLGGIMQVSLREPMKPKRVAVRNLKLSKHNMSVYINRIMGFLY